MARVRLRYFACRGRGEPIRHLLRERGVAFEDEREPTEDLRKTLASWRENPAVVAPFGLVPVLDWEGFRVAQTLPIASFLARELGLAVTRDSRATARLEAVASAAYSDLTCPLPELVFSPVWHPEVPFERHLARLSRTPCAHIARFDGVLGDGDDWFGGAEPHGADFFVFEGLAAWCAILGEPYAAAILRQPKLSSWWRRIEERVRPEATRGVPFTASPFEADVFGRARAFVREHGLSWLR